MASTIPIALESWALPIPLTSAIVLVALVYMRGWFHLRLVSTRVIPAWRAGSLALGLFLIWVALGSPLAALDEESLTVHMAQHLLLMTIAPLLIWLSAPAMPLLHGLPQRFVQVAIGPFFRWPAVQWLGRTLGHPVFCWLAAGVALVVWHFPAVFTLALRSEPWHVVEHASFLSAGLLFWWPVVEPWPSVPTAPRWWILLYLFLATLPCDVLSGFLVFSDRVVYPAYFSAARLFGLSVLEDQEFAGALMWTCITVVYLVLAAVLTTRLLGAGKTGAGEFARPALSCIAAPQNEPQRGEAA